MMEQISKCALNLLLTLKLVFLYEGVNLGYEHALDQYQKYFFICLDAVCYSAFDTGLSSSYPLFILNWIYYIYVACFSCLTVTELQKESYLFEEIYQLLLLYNLLQTVLSDQFCKLSHLVTDVIFDLAKH